jgi:hypothetical protein
MRLKFASTALAVLLFAPSVAQGLSTTGIGTPLTGGPIGNVPSAPMSPTLATPTNLPPATTGGIAGLPGTGTNTTTGSDATGVIVPPPLGIGTSDASNAAAGAGLSPDSTGVTSATPPSVGSMDMGSPATTGSIGASAP